MTTTLEKLVPADALQMKRSAIATGMLEEEDLVVERLLSKARISGADRQTVTARARRLVEAVRAGRQKGGGIDAFLQEYALSNEEGVVLMCLAEALLRVPDPATADKLIRDKIGGADWARHQGASPSLFVNASTWGLMLTGRVVRLPGAVTGDALGTLAKLVQRSGEPVIRQAMLQAMRIMGRQFVLGRTIKEALREAKDDRARGVRFSFDMLGEAARTMADAERYASAYLDAIAQTGRTEDSEAGDADIHARNSVSVKLSALHPRYEEAKRARILEELTPRLRDLAVAAKNAGIGLTVDAEEADRLELSLDLFEQVARDPELRGWNGLGLAVQGYQKRALGVIDWVTALARDLSVRIPMRLVKGAYWDTEIKLHQVLGVEGYPVFTRKASTDVSYLACARAMLQAGDALYPQFASHNAHTLAAISVWADDIQDRAHGDRARPPAPFEFQRLHGMGESLFEEVENGALGQPFPVRIYAPVGSHEDLLAYLVRRLLENGANSSFVNRLADDETSVADIIADPVEAVEALPVKANPKIPLPQAIFPGRINSKGLLLTDRRVYGPLRDRLEARARVPFRAAPLVDGDSLREAGAVRPVRDPADRSRVLGEVVDATPELVERATQSAARAQEAWDRRGGAARADLLDKVADLYEAEQDTLMALCVREAGKTIPNALADLREAVDFLRYYAREARMKFQAPQILPGPTGERNEMSLHGRGVFACISPWNFPVAIFTGQIAAALAAGNTVVAKPAEQTPLVAHEAVRLFLEAGVPGNVLHLLPGDGSSVGAALVEDPRIGGVAFTGGTETARRIHQSLARRSGPILPLIAETGGQNVMIVDSTALPEQVVQDVVMSAFDSAGQRCSAARVLALQEDIADKVITMLTGAMNELKVGDPMDLATDVGPVIDEEALAILEAHADGMHNLGRTLSKVPLTPDLAGGMFFAPRAVEIPGLDVLRREVFGPVLHVMRYKSKDLGALCQSINETGYGLTLGIHTRIEETARFVRERVHVGNLYVNRNQIGAVVGAQPFGGEGLSGTGPKAGGPHYLQRFAAERVVSTDTTASGGNAELLSMEDS